MSAVRSALVAEWWCPDCNWRWGYTERQAAIGPHLLESAIEMHECIEHGIHVPDGGCRVYHEA